MNIINLFIIILILYVCYKIVVYNKKDVKETFTTTEPINLKDNNIFLGKNLFVGVKQNEVDYYNKLKNKDGTNVLDLSKNNMIIKMNDKNSDFQIKENICFDNFCVNGKQMELIGGEIDAPDFRKEKRNEKNQIVEKSVYYNHDSETSFKDLPNKMCFKNKDENSGETNFTCLDYNDFEILNGERGIKFQSSKSPHYIVNNLSFMALLYKEIELMERLKDSNPDYTDGIQNYITFLNKIKLYVDKLTKLNEDLREKFTKKYDSIVEFKIDEFPYRKEISKIITDRINSFYETTTKVVSNSGFINIFLGLINDKAFLTNLKCRIVNDLGEPTDNNYKKIKAIKMKAKGNPFSAILYKKQYYLGQPNETGGIGSKLKDTYKKQIINRRINLSRNLDEIGSLADEIIGFYADPKFTGPASTVPNGPCPTGSTTPTSPGEYNDTITINIFGGEQNLNDFMFSNIRDFVIPDEADEKQFIMPYYMDFRERGKGVASVKDQLFFKENYNCAENNSFYQRNKSFDMLKYPYLKDFDYSEKCAEVTDENKADFCNTSEGRLCYKTCCENSVENSVDNAEWCPAAPVERYSSNRINTDEYPIDIGDSVLKDQLETSRRHGHFIVDLKYIDPNYDGYYIDSKNNNTKFDVKENSFTEISRFFGIDVNHRASHNGICSKYGDLTKTKNFCRGKNSYNPEFESQCNRVSKYRKQLYDKKVEEEELAAGTITESTELTDAATDVTESSETEPVQTTMSIIDELDSLPELNFYIQPANGDDGNIIKSNTYFHAHKHIHE